MKVEMAVLYSHGGAEGFWETVVIDVPTITPDMDYSEMDMLAREFFYTLEEYDECAGCYLFNEDYEKCWVE